MARRRNKNKGLIETLLNSPWQVSVIFAISVFVLMRWIIPSQFSHSQYLTSLAITSKSFAPLTLLFLIPGLLSYIKQYVKKKPAFEISLNRQTTSPVYTNTLMHHAKNVPLKLNESAHINDLKVSPVWSLALLKSLEWKRFELLCAEYFKCLGKYVETMPHGADGGIDVRVYSAKEHVLEYAIQCKSWNSLVGIKPLRELFGVMSHETAGKGIFMTTSDFTAEAKQFASDHSNKLFLIDGEKFVSMILKLPEGTRARLLTFATEGDYVTPSCPSCGIKLIKRTSKTKSFWGCGNFPKCRTTMYV